MATVKVKMRPSAIEGRAGTVYYQITHNRVVRQSKTEYKVFPEEWSDTRANILPSVRERIDRDLKRLETIVDRFDRHNSRYTADDIVRAFAAQSREPSFLNFMQSVISGLKLLNKHRTAENYTAALNSFMQFRESEDLLFDEITTDLMMRYEAYLIDRGVVKNTSSFYMRILRAVYNRAVDQGLSEQRNPFRHVYTGIDRTVKRAISFAAIKRIKALDLSFQPVLGFARDMFLFSFYTRGMSFIDMAYLRKADLKNGALTYRRRKTGQRLTIKWESCMQEIVKKYERYNTDRSITGDSPYLLPILKAPFDSGRSLYRGVLQRINRSLKIIARLAGIDVPLTMYVARHSWASVARSKHIPLSVISEGMGHDSEATTQIYLASLDTAVIDRANRLILKDL